MNITKKELSKFQIELTIEVPEAELQPYLVKAAEDISKETEVPGFRPGKAPYDIIKGRVGEMAIWQRSLDNVIAKTLFEALNKEMPNAEIVSQPQVDIEKMAPGNPLVYKAIVTLLPEITLGDYSKIEVKKKEVKVDPKEIDRTLEYLRNSYAKEEIKLSKLETGDKAEVSFQVFVDSVPIEGGQAEKHPLIIGENRFIPGFEEQLIGLSKNEKKEFELRFPENYHQKNLAGKLAKFKVEVKETFKRTLPELNDDFAKTLGGYKNLAEVRAGVEKNIKDEETRKATERDELEMLDKLIEQTTFSDIPETLVHAEAHRMVGELRVSIEQQGLNFEDYLTHLKKSEEDLVHGFDADAKKRVQTALIIKEIAKREKIEVSDKEIKEEIDRISKFYAENTEAQENIQSPAYKNYLQNILANRKVISWLKEKIIKN